MGYISLLSTRPSIPHTPFRHRQEENGGWDSDPNTEDQQPSLPPHKFRGRQVSPVNLSIVFIFLHLLCHAFPLGGGKATGEQAELVRSSKDELKDKHQTQT